MVEVVATLPSPAPVLRVQISHEITPCEFHKLLLSQGVLCVIYVCNPSRDTGVNQLPFKMRKKSLALFVLVRRKILGSRLEIEFIIILIIYISFLTTFSFSNTQK